MSAVTGTPLGVAFSRLAAADPGTAALTFGGTTLTRRELDERSNRFAWTLRDHDVRVGDRVAVVLPSGIDFVVAVMGVWKAGGTPIPLPDALPDAERDRLLTLAEPSLVIASGGEGVMPPVVDPDQPSSPPPGAISRPWKIVASGGSTGRPKLIANTAPGVVERLTPFGIAAQMSTGGTALLTAPLAHNAAFISLASALLNGKHVVAMADSDPAEALRLAERHRADWMFAVPAMLLRIWRLPAEVRDATDLSSLRVLLHTGAPIAPWLKEAWIDRLGPERVWEIYTGAEAQAVTRISGLEWLAHRGSVGRPLTGDIEVRDDMGRTLGPGRIGRVWMRSDTGPTYTYIGATPTTDGRWESLGDLGYTDPDGYIYLADRETDLITVGDVNVFPAEVEGALEEHPAVRSAAVIGLPDERLGAVPHAIVQADGEAGADEEALLAHLRERLADHQVPRSVEFVTGPLRDDAGKVRRSALRAERLPAGAASSGG